MLLAAALAVVAVALGLALGLVPAGRARVAGPLRTFALSAALTVVLLHLLPEAFSAVGMPALFLFAATSIVPSWLKLARGVFGKHHDDSAAAHGGLVAGYVGLLVHHVGDGLGLGAYAALPGGALAHADVMLALAAHTVPLVAVVAFAFQGAGGSGRALRAAAGLAGASVFGVLVSGITPAASVERYSGWIAALVAGLLVHVVTHDLERDLPTKLGGRALDALAAVAGVATSLIGAEHSAGNHRDAFVADSVRVFGTLSLPVLAGLVLATLAASGKKRAFRRSVAAAFGPNLGVDGLVVASFLGGYALALVLAVGGLSVVRMVAVSLPKEVESARDATPDAPSELPWLVRLDDVIRDSLPFIGAAFVFLVLLSSSFPQRALEVLPLPVAMALAVVVALPVRIPAVAAVLVAAALERAGLRFEAALVFALLAPAPGAVELSKLAHEKSPLVAFTLAYRVVAAVLLVGILAAFGQNILAGRIAPPFPNLTSRFAFLLLAALGLRAAFEHGLRGLLLRIFPSHDTAPLSESPASVPETPLAPEPSPSAENPPSKL